MPIKLSTVHVGYNMEQLAERRNGPRLAINEEVFDQKTGKSIGHTADLNAHGMMLVGAKKFNIGEEMRISLDVPNGRDKKTRTSLTTQCRWSEPHMDTPFYNSGFRFVYATKFDIEYIETLFFGLTEQY
jgi:PilZ domain-containing protein